MNHTGTFYVWPKVGRATVLLNKGEKMTNCALVSKHQVERDKRHGGLLARGFKLLRLRYLGYGNWRVVGKRFKRGTCLRLLEEQKNKLVDDAILRRKSRKGLIVNSNEYFYVVWQDKRGYWYAA